MDKKQTIIGVALALVLMGGWYVLQRHWMKTHPEWYVDPAPVAEAVVPATQPAGTQPTTGYAVAPGATTDPSVVPTTGPAMQTGFAVAAATQPAAPPAVLGSGAADDPQWPMQLVIDPAGASVRSITLNAFKHPADFHKPVKDRRLYEFEQPYADLPDTAALATRSVTINGQTVNLLTGDPARDPRWAWEPTMDPAGKGGQSATFAATVNYAGAPALKLTKTFTVYPKAAAEGGGGYEVRVDYGMQNLSDRPLTVKSAFNGPTLPPREASRPPDRQILAGYRNDRGREIDVVPHQVESFKAAQPTVDLTQHEGRPLAWAGANSVYFSALVLPVTPDGAAPGGFLAKVSATQHDAGNEAIPAEDKPVLMTFETTDVTIEAGQSKALRAQVFFGPRWREVLNANYYVQFPRAYDATLVLKSGMCAFCTFDWLIKGMVLLLQALHVVVRDWGLAIIALVCIVRTLLHPITKKSQVQMMGMSKLGPQMEKLKEKYKDDKDQLNKEMMQFYKQQGFAPVLGCLPMLLQTPIWIALYSSLQTTFELRQAPFLWGFTWIKDLSKPDFLINFGHSVPIPILGWIWPGTWSVDGINILPFLLAGVFFLQQKFTPKPAAMTPEQEQQQKMMQWMVLLFPVMLYSGPSGLNLYILTSTTIGIIESKIIRKHIKEKEEAEKAGVVIIDAPPPDRTLPPPRGGKKPPTPPTPPKGGLGGLWANIQEKVEQARREQERRGKKRT